MPRARPAEWQRGHRNAGRSVSLRCALGGRTKTLQGQELNNDGTSGVKKIVHKRSRMGRRKHGSRNVFNTFRILGPFDDGTCNTYWFVCKDSPALLDGNDEDNCADIVSKATTFEGIEFTVSQSSGIEYNQRQNVSSSYERTPRPPQSNEGTKLISSAKKCILPTRSMHNYCIDRIGIHHVESFSDRPST